MKTMEYKHLEILPRSILGFIEAVLRSLLIFCIYAACQNEARVAAADQVITRKESNLLSKSLNTCRLKFLWRCKPRLYKKYLFVENLNKIKTLQIMLRPCSNSSSTWLRSGIKKSIKIVSKSIVTPFGAPHWDPLAFVRL